MFLVDVDIGLKKCEFRAQSFISWAVLRFQDSEVSVAGLRFHELFWGFRSPFEVSDAVLRFQEQSWGFRSRNEQKWSQPILLVIKDTMNIKITFPLQIPKSKWFSSKIKFPHDMFDISQDTSKMPAFLTRFSKVPTYSLD